MALPTILPPSTPSPAPRTGQALYLPPKKKEEVKERPILGRFKSNLKVGIVGLPNVGKSTLFNSLGQLSIPAENFPFCTIDPNTARVNIPDERFTWLTEQYKPKTTVPAFIDIVDIAGLVKGAAQGEGLGNAFLSHITSVDGIFHVCRCFDDVDVVHVEDRVDPVEDLEIIHSELRAKDLERVKGIQDALKKLVSRGLTKDQKDEVASAEHVAQWLEEGKDIRLGDWTAIEVEFLNANQFITAKPVIYLANLSEKDYIRKKNKWLLKLHTWVESHGGGQIIPFSGQLEGKLLDMPEDERAVYCKENECTSAVPKIIVAGFRAVNLIYFFTCGPEEVRCWQIRKHSKAPQAAGAIHSDFERGFICAEVMRYSELREIGNEQAVKAAGKYKQEGKNYVVEDGDIIHFKFNVTADKKK